MTFVGIFSAPGTPVGPEVTTRNGITYSDTYCGTGTWGVTADGAIYQLCVSHREEDRQNGGNARYWVKHHAEVRGAP